LIRPEGRIDVDAYDEFGNPYELKTTSKGGVSTARDLGYRHLDKWSKRYWIVADFVNRTEGHVFTGFWFLAPEHMEAWYAMIRARLDQDTALTRRAVDAMRLGGATEEDISRVEKLCNDGALLNDPNIPKGYIRKHAIPMIGDQRICLRELVARFPLARTN
jgi:hypothetical protein